MEDDHCLTRVGFEELNSNIPAASKSDIVCVLCDKNYFALNGKCVGPSECKYKDEVKRLCKGT